MVEIFVRRSPYVSSEVGDLVAVRVVQYLSHPSWLQAFVMSLLSTLLGGTKVPLRKSTVTKIPVRPHRQADRDGQTAAATGSGKLHQPATSSQKLHRAATGSQKPPATTSTPARHTENGTRGEVQGNKCRSSTGKLALPRRSLVCQANPLKRAKHESNAGCLRYARPCRAIGAVGRA